MKLTIAPPTELSAAHPLSVQTSNPPATGSVTTPDSSVGRDAHKAGHSRHSAT